MNVVCRRKYRPFKTSTGERATIYATREVDKTFSMFYVLNRKKGTWGVLSNMKHRTRDIDTYFRDGGYISVPHDSVPRLQVWPAGGTN